MLGDAFLHQLPHALSIQEFPMGVFGIVSFMDIFNCLILVRLTGGSHAHGVEHDHQDHGHNHHEHGTEAHGESGSHGHAHSIQDLSVGLAVLGNINV
jgi:ABC-type Zn2+ transport system substrate-binding protein/surface adhesin